MSIIYNAVEYKGERQSRTQLRLRYQLINKNVREDRNCVEYFERANSLMSRESKVVNAFSLNK